MNGPEATAQSAWNHMSLFAPKSNVSETQPANSNQHGVAAPLSGRMQKVFGRSRLAIRCCRVYVMKPGVCACVARRAPRLCRRKSEARSVPGSATKQQGRSWALFSSDSIVRQQRCFICNLTPLLAPSPTTIARAV